MRPTTSAASAVTVLLVAWAAILGPLPVGAFLDPISLSVGAAGLGYLGYSGWLREHTLCRVTECCTDREIPADIDGLRRNLSASLFGQHIVVDRLIPVLRAHYSALGTSRKPLVLSFHGQPGTGKNFVADRVAEHLFRRGAGSQFVHKFVGLLHFPEAQLAAKYAKELAAQVRQAIAVCPRSLFIFDEVDKMPAGVFDQIASLMDHHDNVDKLNFRQATYIFLSNAGGMQIAERLLQHLESGAGRPESRISDYDAILNRAAYNVEGGLRRAAMIETHLVDLYVPFLPMEREHVEACIWAEFRARRKTPARQLVADILKEYVTYQWDIFSTTGCKRLSKLIGMHAEYL